MAHLPKFWNCGPPGRKKVENRSKSLRILYLVPILIIILKIAEMHHAFDQPVLAVETFSIFALLWVVMGIILVVVGLAVGLKALMGCLMEGGGTVDLENGTAVASADQAISSGQVHNAGGRANRALTANTLDDLDDDSESSLREGDFPCAASTRSKVRYIG